MGSKAASVSKADVFFLQEFVRKTAYSQEEHDRLTSVLLYEYARESRVVRKVAEELRLFKGPFCEDQRLPPRPVLDRPGNARPWSKAEERFKDYDAWVVAHDAWTKKHLQRLQLPSRFDAEVASLSRQGISPTLPYFDDLYSLVTLEEFPARSWNDLPREAKERRRRRGRVPAVRPANLEECRELVADGERQAKDWLPRDGAERVFGPECCITPLARRSPGGIIVAFCIDGTETPKKTSQHIHRWLTEFSKKGGYRPSQLPMMGREPAVPRVGGQDKFTKLLALTVMRCWTLYGDGFWIRLQDGRCFEWLTDHLVTDFEASHKRKRRGRGAEKRDKILASDSFWKRVTYALPGVAAEFLHRLFPFDTGKPFNYPPRMSRGSNPWRRA